MTTSSTEITTEIAPCTANRRRRPARCCRAHATAPASPTGIATAIQTHRGQK